MCFRLVVLVLICASVAFVACTTDSEPPPPQQIMSFDVVLFDGGHLNSGELRGKTVVVNFWASWCVPCREEAPDLQRVWRAYRDKHVVFVGMDFKDDDVVAAQTFLREAQIDYPNGQDTDGKLATDFQVVGLPNTFILGKNGRLMHRFIGPVKAERLSARLAQALVN